MDALYLLSYAGVCRRFGRRLGWLRGQDLNLRPSGYEPDELPDCSTPRCAARLTRAGKTLWWRGQDSNLRRPRQQIYSLPRLTASVPLQIADDLPPAFPQPRAGTPRPIIASSRSPCQGRLYCPRRPRAAPNAAPGRRMFRDTWSQRRGSNPQPTAYKAAALPLSYTGTQNFPRREPHPPKAGTPRPRHPKVYHPGARKVKLEGL